jgi:hypothetical protein
MATKLYLRDTTRNGIGSFRDMNTTPGPSLKTAVVNTAASGTNIQWTKTAGGAVMEWISGRVPAGGFTLSGTITANIWALESNMNANAGGRLRYYKRTAAGVETEFATSPADDGVEFGTAAAVMNWTEVPTSTAFAEDDRIIARYFITNVGTMATGFTCTLDYDGPTNAADGDSWFQINETVAFKAETVTQAIGLTTETDSVLTLTAVKTKAIGLNTETDTVTAMGRRSRSGSSPNPRPSSGSPRFEPIPSASIPRRTRRRPSALRARSRSG